MNQKATARKDVLVLDGVDFYRRMLVELMGAQGYRVTEACSGPAAMACLEQERPDLMLLDIDLPPGGGASFLEEAGKRGWIGLKTVALAIAHQDESELSHLRELGVTGFVSRSSPIDDILVATRSALFPEAKDLRRSPRAQVRIPVAYRLVGEDGSPSGEVATQSFNLSADGMFLVSSAREPAPSGSRLALRFWLPAAPEVIEVEGIVIWCNQAGGRLNELYPPGMGVMFLGLKREAVAIINEYVRERTLNPLA